MAPVLEAVPNFSEGRDPDFLDEAVRVASLCGVDVLDRSMDPDHHRAVLTLVGHPDDVEEAGVRLGFLARDRIDLRRHAGVHPRIGALDVLPFVPLVDCTMERAVEVAHRAGRRLAEGGLPVYFYGRASDPPGRGLAELRRGGFEGLRAGFPPDRRPDLDGGRTDVHPTAGAVCVGARTVLLAWNVWIQGVTVEALLPVAAALRERNGGVPGLRALALDLPTRGGVVQLSMNLEGVESRNPMSVFERVEAEVRSLGGEIVGTEVIGMIPEALVLAAAGDRLRLFDPTPDRLLPVGVARHLARRTDEDLAAVLSWLGTRESETPEEIQSAVRRLAGRSRHESSPSERA